MTEQADDAAEHGTTAAGGAPVPVPGGGVPVREWEERLAALDRAAADSPQLTEGVEELLSSLESALEGL